MFFQAPVCPSGISVFIGIWNQACAILCFIRCQCVYHILNCIVRFHLFNTNQCVSVVCHQALVCLSGTSIFYHLSVFFFRYLYFISYKCVLSGISEQTPDKLFAADTSISSVSSQSFRSGSVHATAGITPPSQRKTRAFTVSSQAKGEYSQWHILLFSIPILIGDV